jgi:outer membrane protein
MKRSLFFLAFLLFAHLSFSQAPPRPRMITLSECLDLSVKNSVKLQINALEHKRLIYQRREVMGQGMPDINFNGGWDDYVNLPTQLLPGEFFGKPGELIPVQFGTTYNISGSIDATQIIYNQAFLTGLRLAKQFLEQNNLESEKLETDLVADVAKSYFLAQITKQQIANQYFIMENLDSLLQIAESQHTYGLITGVDVDRINVNRLNLESAIDNLQTLLQQQYSMLKYYMDIPDETVIDLPEVEEGRITAVDTTGSLKNHIDIRMIEKQKEIVETDLKLNRSFYYPALTLIGSVNYLNQSNTFYLFGKNTDWFNTSMVGLRLNVPIFNGLQKRNKVKQSKVQLQQVQLTENDTRRILTIQARDAARKYINSITTESRQRENVKLAERVYHISQDRYSQGMIPLTDMLNAETDLSEAQSGHITALIQMKIAEIDYLKAKGTLLEASEQGNKWTREQVDKGTSE